MKRRILIIVQNLPVPFDRRVWLECQALTRAGYRVAVICPKGKGDPAYEVIDGVELYKYRSYAPGGSKLSFVAEYAYSFTATAWKALLARSRGGRFSALQACNPPDIFWPLAVAFSALERTKFVFDHHDLSPELYESRFGGEDGAPVTQSLPYKGLRFLERRTHRTADHVISTNESYRQVAINRSGKRPQDVTVVRTGPDPDKLRRGEPEQAQRRGHRYLCAYIGVMGPQDGVDIVVRAAGVLVHEMEREDIAFTLIGKGDCFDQMVALRDELKLNGHVEFTGRAPDELVERVMSTADIGLSPDPMNPLNNVSTMNKTMEYMSFELPVVAFDLHETRVSAASAAVYVKPTGDAGQDVRDYARAIADLADDEAERASMAKLGRARVEQELAWSHQERAYVSVYERIAPPKGKLDMCGIAGCYQQADGHKLTDFMTERIAHRGPDSGATWSHEDGRTAIHLGHRRLSIIDLSTSANQPFVKGNLVLVYNGELYNYRELRAELEGKGAAFLTGSDTEVVLESWRRWGPAALERFRGMFAFAIADTVTGELTLARDPLGIKPLLYLRRGDGIVFASELKALLAAVGGELRIEPGAMVASMLYYWVPEQRCSIQGVRKLPAGSWARFRPDGTHEEHTYWNVRDVAAEAAGGPRANLREIIADSVTAHLIADVPVSSFLSGGLDSSIITVLAHQQAASVDAYTITFRPEDQKLEAMPDDAVYARKVARQFGIELHEIEISPDIVDMLPKMVGILDEPIGDPAAINTYLMCQAARERGVKVILSGMGADELFGGYRKHLACLMASRYRRLPGVVRGPARAAVGAMPVSIGNRGLRYPRWAKRFMTFAELPEEARFRRSYTLYDPDDLTALVGRDMAASVDAVVDEHAAIYQDNDLDDEVNRMCLADTRLFMAGLNLTYTDRASMAASVEVRTPFVDLIVARAAFSISGSDKIRGRVAKAALKEAAENWLPQEIVHRPKASFGAPLRAWVRNDLRELINDVLVGGELTQLGLLRKDQVRRLIADEQAGREDYAKQIWQLLSMELWYRQVRSVGVGS